MIPFVVEDRCQSGLSALPSVLEHDVGPRDPAFREALMPLTSSVLPAATWDLVRIYRSTKDLSYRFKILRLLFDEADPELESFFAEAYSRERYLDMKIAALRAKSSSAV